MAGHWRIAALCLVLSACSGGDVRYATLSAELTYPEPVALPPGAQAHMMVREGGAAADPAGEPLIQTSFYGPIELGRTGALVASETYDIAGQQPVRVTVPYNRAIAEPGRTLVIDAWITLGEQVLFSATPLAPVPVGGATPVRIALRRPIHMALACADGSHPSIAFAVLGELAFLEADGGRPVALRAQPAASGFHYASEGYSLRGRGSDAVLRRPSGSDIRCQAPQPSRPPTQSPLLRPIP